MNFLRDVYCSPIFLFYCIFVSKFSRLCFQSTARSIQFKKVLIFKLERLFYFLLSLFSNEQTIRIRLQLAIVIRGLFYLRFAYYDPTDFTKPFFLAYSTIFDGIRSKIRLQLVFFLAIQCSPVIHFISAGRITIAA